jgi:VWFA-related protein
MNPFRAYLGWMLVLVVLTCAAAAQTENQDDQNVPTFKANVNIVNLFFNVKDKHNTLIPNLTKDSFEVLEDGKPQTIKYFSANTDLPLTLGMLIDTSGSQMQVLPMEQEIGAAFLSEVLQKKDLAFVINFDLDADLVQDFTNSSHELRVALNKVKINAPPCGGAPGLGGGPLPSSCRGGTVLYDAVYLAAQEKLKQEVGRKAMIVLTDGQDEGSRLKIQDAIEAAQKADAIVYVLLIADRGFYGGIGYGGDGAMKKMAEQTGGRMINVGNNDKKLKEAFDQIANEMRSQYNIGYTPTNNKQDGSFRKIEIKTKDNGYKVQSRSGYYAQKQNN